MGEATNSTPEGRLGVIVSSHGDTISPSPPGISWDNIDLTARPERRPDDERLGIVVHDICRGWADYKQTATTYNTIRCRSCNLRVVVPGWVRTWGTLREWSALSVPRWRAELEERGNL